MAKVVQSRRHPGGLAQCQARAHGGPRQAMQLCARGRRFQERRADAACVPRALPRNHRAARARRKGVRHSQHRCRARRADLRYRRATAQAGLCQAWTAVPVGIKDIMDTRDMPTQMGSPSTRAGSRGSTPPACTALRQAGAIIVGKTVTTEFACGRSRRDVNPQDPSRTPGGLLERLGRSGRRRHAAGRAGYSDAGLHAAARFVLWRGRVQGLRMAHCRWLACIRSRRRTTTWA
jgi:hypothetical protein